MVFQAPNKETARKLANTLIDTYQDKAPNAMDCLENGLDGGLSVLQLPERYRKRLRTTNLAERMNEEIRRRERVIRIFPSEKAAQRLIGALLADIYEEWQAGIRYFDMSEYWDWKNEQVNQQATENKVVAIG